jgi:hypothetical protein
VHRSLTTNHFIVRCNKQRNDVGKAIANAIADYRTKSATP